MKRKDISDLEVLKAYREHHADIYNTPFPYEILAKKFGCDEKLAYSACERALKKGLLDYGVSLRCGWITDKGNELLAIDTPTTSN